MEGVVGSTAYGLARDGSDEDRLGVFAAPTAAIVGLGWNRHRESIVRHDPDRTLHEAGKFVRLALAGNPTITELLWLDAHTVMSGPGAELVALRHAFLSTRSVRDSYGGYARQQVARLARRGDSFSADTRNRTAKHGRHTFRLLWQGHSLLATGRLTVRLTAAQRDRCFEMGDLAVSDPDRFCALFDAEDAAMRDVESVLPDEPDTARVEAWLVDFRQRAFTAENLTAITVPRRI